jgi:hypothetical protein
MKKLLKWHDAYTLKILVSFLILFTALYPKLPSIHIMRTWVYIRLEDFFILATVIIWLVQLIRRKIDLPKVFAISIGTYWTIGFISLIFSLLFIAPTLQGFFPHIAFLSFLRRIEYMILFFVAFSTIRSEKDVRDYLVIFALTVFSVFLYGLGQKYYIQVWALAPEFFQKYSFCFPSFQTGNEEFAKGIPLCLPEGARITSTFGGSYDLAAYLVLALPIIIGTFIIIKKRIWKLLTGLVFVFGLMLLIFTAQRAAFVAYLIGSIATLIFIKRKLFIIPIIILSIGLLLVFSESTAKRFLSTLRVSNVVVDSQGRLIGEALPDELRRKIRNPKTAELPEGSAFLGLPDNGTQVGTSSAYVQRELTPQEAKRLQLAEGTLQISTVTGSFLVKKVLVYDISFTTRFQAEWPNAWRAFMRNPLLGSGYSSITLATDNDYFRALGETGILGLLSFMGIFLVSWITLKKITPNIKSRLILGFVYGLSGGVVGLALNAILIDVFEASKVAENLWIMMGIGTGGLLLYQKKPIAYKETLQRMLTSNKVLIAYLFFVIGGVFFVTIPNFFVADDFTWLKWAATAKLSDLPGYFINSDNFFYRPLDKIVTFFLYTVFSFQPGGYHLFMLVLHFLGVIAVFSISKKILNDRFMAVLVALIFALVPTHNENILWFSGLSGLMSSVFILYALINYFKFREKRSRIAYVLAFVLSILAFMSYEIAVVIPFLFIVTDIFLLQPKRNKKLYLSYIPFIALVPLYYLMRYISNAFSGGGDYSYSIANFVPNVIGNFFGYIGLFFLSEGFLPLYNTLRTDLRESRIAFILILIALLIFISFMIYTLRKIIVNGFRSDIMRFIIFGLVFAFVSLSPFLPLGNIAPRYLYLASFGLCISFILILKQILSNRVLFLVSVLIFSGWFIFENAKLQKDWKRAGDITKNTLALFRIDYEELKTTDNIYFINTPIKHRNVWVFPVGLEDGLWFIYRDRMPKVYKMTSVDEARADIARRGTRSNYIFVFDKNDDIKRVR